MEKLSRAIEIRDHVLILMRGQSTTEETKGARIAVWRSAGWIAALTTPFNPLGHTTPTEVPAYQHALAYQRASKAMPYELSLWVDRKKVLLVEWSGADDEGARVASFTRGPWEHELLRIAGDRVEAS